MKKHTKMFLRGVDDFKRGVGNNDNPYRGVGLSWYEWFRGWYHAALMCKLAGQSPKEG